MSSYNLISSIYGIEGSFYSPLFDREITVISKKGSDEYVARCMDGFLEMSQELVTKLLSATSTYALEYVEEYGLDDPEIEWEFEEGSPVRDILKYIYPVALTVTPPPYMTEDDAPIAFSLELTCVWELESGLEWRVCGDNAVYVGAYEGDSPWDYRGGDGNYAAE